MTAYRHKVLVAVCIATAAEGQTLSGRVMDSASRAPIAHAAITAQRIDSARVVSATANESGRFSLTLSGRGIYTVTVRRIGYSPVTVAGVEMPTGGRIMNISMGRVGFVLDTVTTIERTGSRLTPGRTFVERHLALGRGIIVSGAEILASGLPASEYLARFDGLSLIAVGTRAKPMVPASKGRFLVSSRGAGCLYARVDWVGLPYLLVSRHRENIDDVLAVQDIRAVELYRTIHETPAEWQMESIVPLLYSRTNAGTRFWMGHTGRPVIDQELLDFDNKRFSTELVFDERAATKPVSGAAAARIYVRTGKVLSSARRDALVMPNCGFLQIWTSLAW